MLTKKEQAAADGILDAAKGEKGSPQVLQLTQAYHELMCAVSTRVAAELEIKRNEKKENEA